MNRSSVFIIGEEYAIIILTFVFSGELTLKSYKWSGRISPSQIIFICCIIFYPVNDDNMEMGIGIHNIYSQQSGFGSVE